MFRFIMTTVCFSTSLQRLFLYATVLLMAACGGGGGGGSSDGGSSGGDNKVTVTITEDENAEWVAGTLSNVQAEANQLFLSLSSVATTYSFTTCGSSLSIGPAQAGCDAAYTGTTLAGLVSVDASGIQSWVVPTTNSYIIQAHGAGHFADSNWLQGAIMRGQFSLNSGDAIKILVGQQGRSARGGSGGSFVTELDNTPVIVAGGAGGMRGNPKEETRAGTTTAGKSVSCPTIVVSGGTAGSGGEDALGGGLCGGAGAGLTGNGQGCGGGLSFSNGGQGGNAAGNYPGGFGGGGGVNNSSSPGGGGGYSGGAVSYTGGGSSCAGGGGSYIASLATNIATSDGNYDGIATFGGAPIASFNNWHTGEGQVTMTEISYESTGTRTSAILDISTASATHGLSNIQWQAIEPANTGLQVETQFSLDGGLSWSGWGVVANNSVLPGLAAGAAMDNARLQTRVTLSTLNATETPRISEIVVNVENILN